MANLPPHSDDPAPAASPPLVGAASDSARVAEDAGAALHAALLGSIDAGFCVIEMIFDTEGRGADYVFLETNPVFERITGLAQVVGSRMRSLVPGHEQHWFDIYAEVARSGLPVRFEQEARELNRWYSVYAFRVGGPPSRRVAVLFEDITTRKRSERRRVFLGELAEKLAPLRDESAIVRVAVGELGAFLKADRCLFVEHPEGGARIILSENHTRPGTRSLEGAMNLGPFGGEEWWSNCSRGNVRVEDVDTHPLTRHRRASFVAIGVRACLAQPFRSERRPRVVLVLTEQSPRRWTEDEMKLVDDVVSRVWPLVERARSERALIAAHEVLEQRVVERTERLQEVVSELESYSYSISHDLRSPLRAMQTYASILIEECGAQMGPEGIEYLQRITASAERMDRLIRDVLVFSRASRGQTPLERVEPEPLIASIIDSYPRLSPADSDIELTAPLHPVLANPAALTQCISNLLGNAIKFGRPGLRPNIRIWSEKTDHRVRLFFRDNGRGIPPELHDKIFGIFYQGNREAEGTGIGLALVRKAVERMGGRVGVASTPGSGSTFWLELDHAPAR